MQCIQIHDKVYVNLIETFRILYTLDMLYSSHLDAQRSFETIPKTYFDDLRFFGISYEFTSS